MYATVLLLVLQNWKGIVLICSIVILILLAAWFLSRPVFWVLLVIVCSGGAAYGAVLYRQRRVAEEASLYGTGFDGTEMFQRNPA